MTTRTLYIKTIGCQMNVYDSERIESVLTPLGYCATAHENSADLIVVNTCAIRAKAEQKLYSYLGRLAPLKRSQPDLIIAVGGCVAQQEGRQMLRRVPHLDLVFGTHAIERLPGLVQRIDRQKCRLVDVEMQTDPAATALPNPQQSAAVSRFVTIMHGCDNYCTYCVVPYVRGREISRPPEDIVSEISGLVAAGVREVTLLGQNVNSYGTKGQDADFVSLLDQIDRIRGLKRVRFTTSHPKDLSPRLIAAFARVQKLCPHIHLPVQSGSDTVLKRMNRGYTRARYLDQVDRLRQACPEIAISTDFIVGFPGETDTDFEATLALMRTVAFDSVFAFKYSDRPSAPATRFKEKVPRSVKAERLARLLELQEGYTLASNRALLGTVQPVLVEGKSKKNDASGSVQWSGRTPSNKIVNFDRRQSEDPTPLVGTILGVTIERAYCHSLWGDTGRPERRQAVCCIKRT